MSDQTSLAQRISGWLDTLKTHKLEGMHYAALKDARTELGVSRKQE